MCAKGQIVMSIFQKAAIIGSALLLFGCEGLDSTTTASIVGNDPSLGGGIYSSHGLNKLPTRQLALQNANCTVGNALASGLEKGEFKAHCPTSMNSELTEAFLAGDDLRLKGLEKQKIEREIKQMQARMQMFDAHPTEIRRSRLKLVLAKKRYREALEAEQLAQNIYSAYEAKAGS